MRMRTIGAALSWTLLTLVPVAACSGPDSSTSSAGSPTSPGGGPSSAGSAQPTLGGGSTSPVQPPATPMDELEKPIAAQLAKQVRRQGLTLQYLACPDWDGGTPRRLTCHGYFDGVTAPVRVRLSKSGTGAVNFDASLEHGVIATQNLVRRLRHQGYRHVDCGDRPAYPSRVGLQLVCSVQRQGSHGFVLATVTDRTGAVRVTDY